MSDFESKNKNSQHLENSNLSIDILTIKQTYKILRVLKVYYTRHNPFIQVRD